MNTLLLRLAGPMQSWGDSSRFTKRHTASQPTKSGVLGLLAAAQGRRRTDPIEDLAGLWFGVRVDQRGQLMRDFQTARTLDGRESMPLAMKYYLSDAAFVAAVSGPASLVAGLAEAVQAPRFPLYLGRRGCPPSRPVFLEVSRLSAPEALRSTPWQAADWYRAEQGREVHLELLTDDLPDEEHPHELVRDLPLSYDPAGREYGWRRVVRPYPVVMPNPDGRDEPDFLAAYGGA